MAKQRKSSGNRKPVDTSSVDTSLFNKGMIKDMNASFQGEQVWSHARNAYNNSHQGDVGVIGNEPSNFSCAEILYTIIGAIHLYADKWVIFSTDDFTSEIGLFDDSECEYEVLVNDNLAAGCLGFNKDYLIKGASKENFDCTWQVYWDDGKNPSRTLNVDNIPWEQNIISDPGADCIEYEDTDILDCEKLRLAPLLDTPCVKLSQADDGGQLRNGGYQAFVAYTVNEQRIGDFIGISNFQSLFDHNDTSGSLIVNITDLDQDFDYYELVIVSNNQQEIQAKRIGLYSTQQSRVHLDHIDQKLESIPLEIIPLRNPAYEKSDSMYVVNDWLIRSGPTEQFDFNYQPLANEITTKWVSAEYPADYYYNGGNKPTFMRDEVYAFFIRWIYNTGERSSSYHIPGRPPGTYDFPVGGSIIEDDKSSGINTIESSDEFNFNKWNTASVEVDIGNNTVDYSEPTEDGGLVTKKGKMAYWQSSEIYPPDKPDIWADLCGKPIRHHKMPDESTHGSTALASTDGKGIKVLGVEFSNIQIPVDNGDPDAGIPGSPIPNVVGYEILRGSREGNKSILAKGIIKNMRLYDIPSSQDIEEGGQHQVYDPATNTWANTTSPATQGLYPNFPYNDLREDYYHTQTPSDGCYPSLDFLEGYSKEVYTFHSPDLMFRVPHLNPYECRLYSAYQGQSTGHFIPSEEHPQHKLLKNGGALLAVIIGAGYAMSKFRGKRVMNYKNAVPSSIGLYGTTPGVSVAPAAPTFGNAGSVGLQTLLNTAVDALIEEIKDGIFFGADVFTGGTATEIQRYLQFRTETAFMEGGSAGYIGGTIDEAVEGGSWNELPSVFKIMKSIYQFILFTTEGGQEVIDLIYNFVSPRQFAYKYNSHGFYQKAISIPETGIRFRSRLKNSAYLNNSYQSFGSDYKINNLFRPKTVAIETVGQFEAVSDSNGVGAQEDTSRFTILSDGRSSLDKWEDPGAFTKHPISAYYAGLKFSFENQYGQLDGIRQIPMKGCVLAAPLGLGQPTSSGHIFGGDCYVNRYTEKCIMPIFWDFLKGQPDNFPFDYRGHTNIPFPAYWMNTQRYQLSGMVSGFFQNLTSGTNVKDDSGYEDSDLQAVLPKDLFKLDWNFLEECFGVDTWGFKRNMKNMFNVTNGYMYTHCNGVNDFFVESEINLAQRDWEEEPGKKHFDWHEYGDYDELFHANTIKKGNFYKYDYSLSISRFWSNLISFGNIQPTDYDPFVAETCYKYYPKRLIYSLQAQLEAKKDFWRVFLPQNYKDFKSKVNVIKPVSKSGALVLFPYLSPQVFDGVQRLETVDAATTLTIGDGGLFSQPFQNVVNSDLSNEYGSCESMRSVINTPSGLYFISQAQGKVFNYTGQGLENIANRGMKWWFNEYLPSFLIKQYPELEGHTLADNPVAGIGCQAIYDPNDDIVYFCKTDYKVKDKYSNGNHVLDGEVYFDPDNGFCFQSEFVPSPPGPGGGAQGRYGQECIPIDIGDPTYFNNCSWTVSYDPKAKAWISFHDWHPELCLPSINHFMTTKKQLRDRVSCPKGYYWNGTVCVRTFEETLPALIEVSETEPLISGGIDLCVGGRQTFGRPKEYTDLHGLPEPDETDPYEIVEGTTPWERFCFNGSSRLRISNAPGGGGPAFNNITFKNSNLLPDGTIYGITINPLSPVVTTPSLHPNYQLGFTVDSLIPSPVDAYFDINNATYLSGYEFLGSFKEGDIAMDDPVSNLPQPKMTEGDNIGPRQVHNFYHRANTTIPAVYNVNAYTAPNNQHAVNFCSYYFNKDIQKFVIAEAITGTKNSGDIRWVTFNPHRNQTVDGNPTASKELTTTNWDVKPFGGTPGNPLQWTIDENDGYKVKPAWDIAFNNVIQCNYNSARYNGFYSLCNFVDYTHEVTIGSTNNDNDTIGIVIAAFKDELGEYPPAGVTPGSPEAMGKTHTLSVVFNMESTSYSTSPQGTTNNSVRVLYNIGQESIAVNRYIENPNVDFGSCPMVVTPYQPTYGTCDIPTWVNAPCETYPLPPEFIETAICILSSPFNPFNSNDIAPGDTPCYNENCDNGNYNEKGNVRVKIKKTGTRIQIWVTQSMGDTSSAQAANAAINVGDPNPYISFTNPAEDTLFVPDNPKAVLFDFDLVDPCKDYEPGYSTPWNITRSQPFNTPETKFYKNYCRGDELEKFVPQGKVGYLTLSQKDTQFFDIVFEGEQVSDYTCECPEGFTEVYLNGSSNPPQFTLEEGDCEDGKVMCRKVECVCPPPTYDGSVLTEQLGECDNVYEVYTPGGTGNPDYVNLDPLRCTYTYEDQVPPIKDFGSIWKHNFRCDSFGNYYDVQYPWEIELIETTGQAVNMLRSVEYQLECYVYKGNLEWNCGDRWHDLDWNFDEAIIYNTEQVSGLLKFNILPKGDPITALQYPTVGTADIQILYTKEEQKYRFNQFWDITEDRGEFTSVERQIFITQLNGYIKDLNAANLNYNKPPTQRKKFRHYYNKVFLRSIDSQNRKMLLKLVNTKLNYSFR